MYQPLKSQAGFAARNAVVGTVNAPAPVGGLNTRDAEATMQPIFATVMENFWPQERFLGIRKGWQAHLTGLAKQVEHLAAWRGPTSSKLFAFTDDGAFDATTAGAAGATVKALTSGEVVSTNFNVSGGAYLFCVNGVDDLCHYNGTTWTTVATYTVGAGPATVDTDKFSYVQAHQRALFFVEKDSLNFYYLPINQISGAINLFPLGALFSKGGKLVAMGSWTVDGGSGVNDLAVFLTSEGQAAVYQGSDPSDASKWSLQGVYDVGRPLGKQPLANLGGDLLILTAYGLMSMAKVLRAGFANEKTTYTELVSARYRDYVRAYESRQGWKVAINQSLNLLLINVPNSTPRGHTQLAMNLITNAWTEFTGWDTIGWELFGSDLYAGFGTTVGKVWTNTDDNGTRIPCFVQCAWNYLGKRTKIKNLSLLRFLIRLGGAIRLSAGVDTDFKLGYEWQTVTNLNENLARYDEDEWDTAAWASLPDMRLDWLTLACQSGHCLAPRLRVFAGDCTFEWSAIDYAFTEGGVM